MFFNMKLKILSYFRGFFLFFFGDVLLIGHR